MNISRNFLLIGGIYLVIGIAMGMHMGAAGDHSMSVAHAHINLIGFTLSVLFALTYRAFADMGRAVWRSGISGCTRSAGRLFWCC